MEIILLVPWYFFLIPLLIFVTWFFGVIFIFKQYKKTLEFQKRSIAGKKGHITRKWKKIEEKLKKKGNKS